MIRFIVVLIAGLGIGYTYGFLQGDAGDENVLDRGLAAIGVHGAAADSRASVARIRKEEAHRQFAGDSIRQARDDSIASLVHH